jgi:hypothetical protein
MQGGNAVRVVTRRDKVSPIPTFDHYCNKSTKTDETQGFSAYKFKVVNTGLWADTTA